MSKKPSPIRTEPITAADVHNLVANSMEPNEPDEISRIVASLKGKLLSKAHLKLFPGGAERWSLRREYGMTNLESAGYRNARFGRNDSPDPNDYYSYLLGWSESNVRWGEPAPNNPERTFENVNPQYFDARVKRNALRREAIASGHLTEMAEALESLRLARLAVAEAEAKVEAMTAYDEPFNPERYNLLRLVGGGTD